MIITTEWYERLKGHVPDEILLLKDERGQYYLNRASENNIKYFVGNLLETPWRNYLAFGLVISSFKNLDAQTEFCYLRHLHSLFKETFKHFELTEWEEFNPNEYLYKYANGEYANHSFRTRSTYLSEYFTMADAQRHFVRSKFDELTRQTFEKYLLPETSFKMKDLRIGKKRKRRK